MLIPRFCHCWIEKIRAHAHQSVGASRCWIDFCPRSGDRGTESERKFLTRGGIVLAVVVVVLTSTGCLRRGTTPNTTPAPTAFYNTPSLDEIIAAVNTSSARVRQLQTTGAVLVVDGHELRADLAFERPRRLRLKAGTMITGAEFDLGSNDELIWTWVNRMQPPAVYFARHVDIERGALGDALPVSPDWLIEATGLIWLDPQAQHEGPWQTQPGRIEIRSPIHIGGTNLWRTIVLDDTRGWVLEQRLVDSQGQVVASSVTSEHQYDPMQGVSLPRLIQISLPLSNISFTLQVSGYLVNQLDTESQTLFEMPQPPGVALLDLADPKTRPPLQPGQTMPLARALPLEKKESRRDWMRRYQGFSEVR